MSKEIIKTLEELQALAIGTVIVGHDGSVGEVFGIDDIDEEDYGYKLTPAIRWAGSDIYDYLDGFTSPTALLPAKIIYVKEG